MAVNRPAGGRGLALGPRTTVWTLLEAYPFLQGFLAAYHEQFRRLATPEGRGRWARVASLEEVALAMDLTWRQLARDIAAEVTRAGAAAPTVMGRVAAAGARDGRVDDLRDIAARLEDGGSLMELAKELERAMDGAVPVEQADFERALADAAAAERLAVRETSHGPIVTGDLALKWVALDPANLRLPSTNVMQAGDPTGVERALDGFLGPAQNVVYADAAGTIGWRATGLVPVRRPGTDGSVPYDGSDPENDWRGFVPQAEMPRVENPVEGFLVTANQRVAGTSWRHVLGTDWPSPARARRVATLLETAKREGRKLDRAAIEAIQFDTASPVLAATMEAFAPLLPAEWAGRFHGWDGRADAASREFLLARTFRRKLGERVLAAWHVAPDIGLAEYRVLDLARADDAAFRRAGLGPKAAFITSVFEETLADLSARHGKDASRWRWGDANRLTVRHPLGRIPGLSWLFDPPSFPQSGATGVVHVASGAFGQSMRFIVDWGVPEEATLVIPFGVSGHVGSPHRLDQLPFWRDGDASGSATRLSRPARETAGFAP